MPMVEQTTFQVVAADPEDAAVLAAGAVEKVEDLIRQRQAVDHLYKPFGNG